MLSIAALFSAGQAASAIEVLSPIFRDFLQLGFLQLAIASLVFSFVFLGLPAGVLPKEFPLGQANDMTAWQTVFPRETFLAG